MDTSTLILVGVGALLAIGVVIWLVSHRSPSSTVDTLSRSPFSIGSAIRAAFAGKADDEAWERIEEILLAADVGVEVTDELVGRARARHPKSADEAIAALSDEFAVEFSGKDRSLRLNGAPAVVLVVGVNGSGKTTTIAKLTSRLLAEGKTVVLGAGDTFRAAAGEQLKTWGDRLGTRVVVGQDGGDPASVAYDTIDAAKAAGADVAIIDTAGRLHGKKNLMSELAKIYRVAGGDTVSEVLLVLDATAGQNGLAQVEAFADVVAVTGIVLTKLDGTAKGGIVVAVERRLGVPVKFVGLGESLEHLMPFEPDSFVTDLLEDI